MLTHCEDLLREQLYQQQMLPPPHQSPHSSIAPMQLLPVTAPVAAASPTALMKVAVMTLDATVAATVGREDKNQTSVYLVSTCIISVVPS